MAHSTATELFQEYADAYARGEKPRAREYLERADASDHELLTELIDRFVAAMPARTPARDDAALLDAWIGGESPLLALRKRRRLKRTAVVDELMATLQLEPAKRERVRLRYHELETGQIEPARVDRRVWEALARVLGTRGEELSTWARPAKQFEPDLAFFRLADAPASVASLAPKDEPRFDEVDRLFGHGRPDA